MHALELVSHALHISGPRARGSACLVRPQLLYISKQALMKDFGIGIKLILLATFFRNRGWCCAGVYRVVHQLGRPFGNLMV